MILLTLKAMKKFIITSILAALVTLGSAVMAQERPDEYLGLPGDNLNLYAVMNLFQESKTLEDFERDLNAQNSRVNNLDLNGDNLVDYITVNDYVDGNVHNIVLRVALTRHETQDVAVFTVQRFNDGSVQIQLVGDEALYGRNYIVEPIYDNYTAGTYNPGYTGRNNIRISVVADWPLVRFIYYPGYISWHSSWYWGYYPSYWDPWRPYYWDYYYGYYQNWYPEYYRHYRRWHYNRYDRYHDFYFSHVRSHSPMYYHRMREGQFRDTYSHPETRREGAALYSRMNSGRSDNYGMNSQSRRGNNEINSQGGRGSNEINNQGRRGSAQPNRVMSSNTPNSVNSRRSGSDIRTAPAVSNRSVLRPETVQRSNDSRRSAPTVSNRSVSRPESVQRSSDSRRSYPTVTSRSASRSESVQRPNYTQRSTPSASTRSASRPESVERPNYTQRSTPSASTRSASRPESVQRPNYSQRSAPSASTRSASRPEQSQRRESVSSSRPSAPSARSSSQGSSKSSGKESSSNKNSNSGSSQSSRRR
jgi:hypothetical protein